MLSSHQPPPLHGRHCLRSGKSLLSVVALVALSACDGNPFGDSPNPAALVYGAVPNVLVNVAPLASANACPNGGLQIQSGLDSNADGVLQASEVSSTQYVCSGAAEAAADPDRPSTLVAVVPVAADAGCRHGGNQVLAGLDISGDGILHSLAITSATLVCNANPAAQGNAALLLVRGVAAGAQCAYGGTYRVAHHGQRLHAKPSACIKSRADRVQLRSSVRIRAGLGWGVVRFASLQSGPATQAGLSPSAGHGVLPLQGASRERVR